MGYIDQSKSIGYYTRPFSLIRRSNQGNGPFTFIQLSLKMEAKKNERESTDDKILRLRAERHERERQHAAAEGH